MILCNSCHCIFLILAGNRRFYWRELAFSDGVGQVTGVRSMSAAVDVGHQMIDVKHVA